VVSTAVTSALLRGFLVSLISLKVKSRWCPQYGATTTAALPAAVNPPRPASTPSWATLPTQSYDQVGRAGALTSAQRCCANGGH
jgi:hypothetical protein